MYSKEQASQLRQEFWTAFGKYISPHPSAEGTRVNWVNYRTGIRHLHFKMQADNRSAFIAIEMTHPDAGIQELVFEQFKELRNILNSSLNEDWDWLLHLDNREGRTVSRIVKTLPETSIFNKNDWPALISFFKPRIIALDEFWSDAKLLFEIFR